MKCPQCGAEIGNTKYCQFCGSQITLDMRREQEQLNKEGCPRCGSGNVSFSREKQGEYQGKNSKRVVTRTIGMCRDCGATWYADSEVKERKTWLWVLGWIFIFPLPLTVLLLRKKDMNKVLKYGIIAVVWLFYVIIALSGGGEDADNANMNSDYNSEIGVSTTADYSVESTSETELISTTESTTQGTTTETTTEVTTTETTTEKITKETTTEKTTKATTTKKEPAKESYVLNTNTKKIHHPGCSAVGKMKDKNKREVTDTVEHLENQGYSKCGICF